MSNQLFNRPQKNEYDSYYEHYVSLVPTDNIIEHLQVTKMATIAYLQSIPTEKWSFRYAEGKWSLKESWIHVLDTERVFAYRAMRISRNDATPLPSYPHNEYVQFYDAENRTAASIIEEYETVRNATIAFFKNLNTAALQRIGTASDCPVSVRALAFMIGGHELHHLNLTRERYMI